MRFFTKNKLFFSTLLLGAVFAVFNIWCLSLFAVLPADAAITQVDMATHSMDREVMTRSSGMAENSLMPCCVKEHRVPSADTLPKKFSQADDLLSNTSVSVPESLDLSFSEISFLSYRNYSLSPPRSAVAKKE